jgi:hypothetical protein
MQQTKRSKEGCRNDNVNEVVPHEGETCTAPSLTKRRICLARGGVGRARADKRATVGERCEGGYSHGQQGNWRPLNAASWHGRKSSLSPRRRHSRPMSRAVAAAQHGHSAVSMTFFSWKDRVCAAGAAQVRTVGKHALEIAGSVCHGGAEIIGGVRWIKSRSPTPT